jgi:hypothetical protein
MWTRKRTEKAKKPFSSRILLQYEEWKMRRNYIGSVHVNMWIAWLRTIYALTVRKPISYRQRIRNGKPKRQAAARGL